MIPQVLETFKQFQIIHCLCPKCNSVSRLSDYHVFSIGKNTKTWHDDYDSKLQKIENKELKFLEEEKAIRESAHMRARNQVPELIQNAMNERFSSMKINPYDIKPILHPIEFVLFDGLHADNLKSVTLLGQKTNLSHISTLQNQISDCIKEKQYGWNVARVSNDGNVEFEN